ncbi:NAD(P)H-binding protein [Streptomyces hoynatensis]|uniref:NAD-dependent epimerase/dehydratase family protein n=1 Tax=Streptomyces hoynatensis TaxID=1141874 RepID=A0A3A9YWX8_9ACTN|nr:NAD(P)H-binding protein [Streptomyces hoynatensis]RKN40435.1 NAD-dependent epimerase/dehydratase family protein [Streptomyces hoynatensis]
MIVVTGATGNVGRPLVRALAAAGRQVTAVSRGTAADRVPPGVRQVRADLADPAGPGPAFEGAEAVFLLLTGEWPAATGGDPGRLLGAVRAGGARRVVLLSSQGVGSGRHPADLEEAVKGLGLDWTVLRPGGFASNAFQWAAEVRERRTVSAPFGDVALPVIDPEDIAAAAAATLLGEGHEKQTYELTGPVPVSPREQAAALGEAIGEPVAFVELSRAEARERMLRFMPEPVAEATLGILGEPSARERQVSGDVERLLGRPPRPFAAWAARNAAAFA